MVYRNLTFNSVNRVSTSTNDNPVFTITPPIQDIDEIKVVSANIPTSFYAFKNLTLIIQESSGSPFTITLNGNFTSTNILTSLNALLTAGSVNILTYTCSYSSITGKLTITANGNFFVKTTGTANGYLGFVNPTQEAGNSQVGDAVMNLAGASIIYLCSPELSAIQKRSVVDGNSLTPVIASIPIQQISYSYNLYESNDYDFATCDGSSLNNVSFYILDNLGNQVSLNGIEFSVILGIKSSS